jgi:class 3 adenylate cyclase/predicted ATPase
MDVSIWLRDLGLQNYARAFRANDIDAEVLSRLTAEDLIALGISSIGHRRRLLDAIALLQSGPAPAAAGPSAAILRPVEAERRQLTVLFCDLVGSTELAARLDPEDLREVMRAYHRATAAVVERFEGHVAKYLGDGVLAYFGWPRAHEDDAERAVRAGLALAQAVARLEPRAEVRLQARVGIATGQVVVGDLVGEGASREEAVVGGTPNLAARLQALAEPGSVVIAQATRRLVGGVFELDDLGPQRLKGFAAPLLAWRVAGAGLAEDRFEARQTAGLTPLVGREKEIALLLRRWEQARDGEGQVVLLAGEPGIGKSRLVREMRERLAEERHIRLVYQCSPHHTTSPLHPVIEQLERAAAFARDDAADAKIDKLETLSARGTEKLDEAVPLIAALLGVPTGERYALPEMTPQRQKQRTLEALVDQLDELAAEQPVLLAYEDVHWIDPTTQELLGLTIERIQRLPVFLVVTFRPEFAPPWLGQPHVSWLALARLGRRDGAAMVEEVVGAKALPDEVSAQIVAKTDGVPLFVEELTKAVLESGLLKDAGHRYELSGPLPPLAIPSTLHDSLLARLDRLGPVKEVAQIGAAIGREFSHALLAAVADRPEPELQAALDQLVASELVFRGGTPPEATYRFKHVLVQDAAYGTLLKSRRQQLHARIAKVLEERFPATVESEPEVLAHHCAAAGLADRAAAYWHEAAQLALARSAATEAMARLSRGLDLLQSLPDRPERDRRELDLQVTLGGASLAAKGWGAPETGRAYARARELCERLGETRQLFPVLWGLTVFHINRGEPGAGREVAEEMLRLGEGQDDVAVQVASHRALAAALYHLGEFASTREHLERVLNFCDPPSNRPPPSVFAVDHRAMALSFLPPTLLALGYPDQGHARSREALAYAQQLAHPHSLALALSRTCHFHCIARDWEAALAPTEALVALSIEHGFVHYSAMGDLYRGGALAELGQAREGFALCEEALAALGPEGANVSTLILGLQAEVHHKSGEPEEALRLLAKAINRARRTGECYFEAELRRLRGEALLSLQESHAAEAESCFQHALAVAHGQSAKMWGLRAATSLARLWRDQGRRAEACDLLAPVYGWFTEGFDTADLKEAKALLDQLA